MQLLKLNPLRREYQGYSMLQQSLFQDLSNQIYIQQKLHQLEVKQTNRKLL